MNELKGSLTKLKPLNPEEQLELKPIAIARLPEYQHSKIHISYKLQRLSECRSTVLPDVKDKGFEVAPSVHFNCCMKFEKRRKINYYHHYF